MINELKNKKEIEDEKKLMDAIHKQAKERYCFDKGRAYLKTQKKNTCKIQEFIICSVLVIVPMAFLLLALVVAN